LFYFDEGMDTGDIIAQERFSIGQDETIADLLSKVTTLTKRILRINIPLILAGNAARTAQDHSMASYCSQRIAEDGLIQWSATDTHIYNAIRAQARPYPGAFTFLQDGRRIYIWSAEVYAYDYLGNPGQVVEVGRSRVVVTCGSGAISVERVQIEGQGEVDAPTALRFGMRLG
jgi:methionyl-tRNA formyltransferase